MSRYCPCICAERISKKSDVGIAEWNLEWVGPRAILDVKGPLTHAAIVSP